MSDDDELALIVSEFVAEGRESASALERSLAEAQAGGPGAAASLDAAFRAVHTVKGNAAALGFGAVAALCDAGEESLASARSSRAGLSPALCEALGELVQGLRSLLARVDATGDDSGGQDAAAQVAELLAAAGRPVDGQQVGSPEQIEAEIRQAPMPRLGEILFQQGYAGADDVVGAVLAQRMGDRRRLGEILVDRGTVRRDDIDRALLVQSDRDGGAGAQVRVDAALLDRLRDLAAELVAELAGTGAGRAAVLAGQIADEVARARMQPVGHAWGQLPRLVAALAADQGKQVRIEMRGQDVVLDRTVLDALRGPLAHLIRNAVAHGIEPPDRRAAAGKPAQGVLRLEARARDGRVLVRLSDDGAGVDTRAVADAAVAVGALDPAQAAGLAPDRALALMFVPGVSTAPGVDAVSGRGVGMDAVAAQVAAAGGTVASGTGPGAGTWFEIDLPARR